MEKNDKRKITKLVFRFLFYARRQRARLRAEAHQLLFAGQVRSFRVEVPQGSGAQLLLGLGVQHLRSGDAGEQQQQRAEQRAARQPGTAVRGSGARHGCGSNGRSTRADTFYLAPTIYSLHLSL